MKGLFTTALLVLGLTAYGQTTVTLTENLVLTETLEISEATTYEGNGFAIICEGCDPAIRIAKDIRVHFENVRFPKTYQSWIQVTGGDMSNVSWNNRVMRGFIKGEDGNN